MFFKGYVTILECTHCKVLGVATVLLLQQVQGQFHILHEFLTSLFFAVCFKYKVDVTLNPPYDASLNHSSRSSLLFSFFWLYNHKHFKWPAIIWSIKAPHSFFVASHKGFYQNPKHENRMAEWVSHSVKTKVKRRSMIKVFDIRDAAALF